MKLRPSLYGARLGIHPTQLVLAGVVALAIIVSLVWIGRQAAPEMSSPGYGALATFRTTNLQVDSTTTLNTLTGTTTIGPAATTAGVQLTVRGASSVFTSSPAAATTGTSAITVTRAGTFDTTAGVLTSTGETISVTSARSAGANALTNIGATYTASGAQTNIAVSTTDGSNYLNTSSGNTCVGVASGGTCAAKLTVTGSGTFSTTLGVDGIFTMGNATTVGPHVFQGRVVGTNTTTANNGFAYENASTATTTSGRAAVVGAWTGTADTTAGNITLRGVDGTNACTESAGGNTLTCQGVRGFCSGTSDNCEGVNGNATGTGATSYGGRFSVTGAATTNRAIYGTATTGATNIAIETDDGDVIFNDLSGTFRTDGNATLGDATTDSVTAWGHLILLGTAPAASSCGGSPTVVGTDRAFKGTVGSAITTCTWTFSRTYTVAPTCSVFVEGGTTYPTCTISATAITCTVAIASTVYNWNCATSSGGT